MIYEGHSSPAGARYAIAASRFHEPIVRRLVDGAVDELERAGAARDDVDVAWCPGAFELPLVSRRLAESGRYAAVLALGCVIRGDTDHYEYVSGAAAEGILRTTLDTGVPVLFGVLTAQRVFARMSEGAIFTADNAADLGGIGDNVLWAAIATVLIVPNASAWVRGEGGFHISLHDWAVLMGVLGAAIALHIAGQPVSLPVLIGILMLFGIVAKNSILLVDFAVEMMNHGMDKDEAIYEAGHKRAQPIVMTTVAMVAGMIPSAMAFGDGGEFRSPMAIAVIGGLLVSTVLSLVFVPSFFTVMDDIGRFVWWIFGRFIGPTDEPPAEVAPHHASAPRLVPAVPHRVAPPRPMAAE